MMIIISVALHCHLTARRFWVRFLLGALFGAQVGYLPGFSVWGLHVLPVLTWDPVPQRTQITTCGQITLLSRHVGST